MPTVKQRKKRMPRDAGRSMLEMLATVAIIIILLGMVITTFVRILPTMRADSAMQEMMAQLRQAREISIDQRRYVTVTFQNTNEMVSYRYDHPGVDNGTTQLSDYVLPYGATFGVVSGVGNTPDAFGGTGTGVNFCAGLPCTITFQSDGTVLTSCTFTTGNCTSGTYTNGTVFINISAVSNTARAVTVLSATGRLRGYRYTGTTWF